MEFLKDVLGEEMFAEVATVLSTRDDIKIVNLKGGEFFTKEEVNELRLSNETLQAKMKDGLIEKSILLARARNVAAVKGLLDLDAIEMSDQGVMGLDEQLKRLKESDGYLFEDEQQPNTHAGNPAANTMILNFDNMTDEELFDARMR